MPLKKKHYHLSMIIYTISQSPIIKVRCYQNNVLDLKGEFTFFFIRELDVPPLGESNLMGPKKSVEVKFFTVAFFGGCRASSNGARCHHWGDIQFANKKM